MSKGLTRLKATILMDYSKQDKNGNLIDVFVYTLAGTKSALERYEQVQGDHFRADDDGNPLFFSTRYFQDKGEVIITQNDKVAPNLSNFKRQRSLIAQNGGNLGDAMAQIAAKQLMGVGSSPSGEVHKASNDKLSSDEDEVIKALEGAEDSSDDADLDK